jgi:hypothetical protein
LDGGESGELSSPITNSYSCESGNEEFVVTLMMSGELVTSQFEARS